MGGPDRLAFVVMGLRFGDSVLFFIAARPSSLYGMCICVAVKAALYCASSFPAGQDPSQGCLQLQQAAVWCCMTV